MYHKMQNAKINTHEYLKHEIYNQTPDVNYSSSASNMPSTSINANASQLYMIPSSPMAQMMPLSSPSAQQTEITGVTDTTLYLDSYFRIERDSILSGELGFQLKSSINSHKPITNCVQIKFGEFFFQNIINDVVYPEFYYHRRLYVQLLPNSTFLNSTSRFDGGKHHFEFSVENTTGAAVLLRPVNASYYFNNPIQTIEEFGIRFLVPDGYGTFKRVPLRHDAVMARGLAGTNPARFELVSENFVPHIVDSVPNTFPGVDYTPSTPVAVFIKNFTSADTNLNSQVNNPSGLFIDNFTTNLQTFEISSLDFTTLGANTNCEIFIAKNRIAMPVRFTSIANNNYIKIRHE